jgi:hypothetical protein
MRVKEDLIDRVYLQMLLWQCEACFVALHRARGESDSARRSADIERAPNYFANQQAFSDFQCALAFAANVGKMLWPPGKGARKERLRRLLGDVGGESSLRAATAKIRNHFEHLDERIDSWSASSNGGSVLIHSLTDETFDIPASNLFNRYDPETETFWMLGDSIDLVELELSLKRIRDIAVRAEYCLRDRKRADESGGKV